VKIKTNMKVALVLLAIVAFAVGGTAVFMLPKMTDNSTSVVVQGTLETDVMGEPLQLDLSISVVGSSVNSLKGIGKVKDAACGESAIAAEGAINGTTLTLSSSVYQGIDTPELKDTPVNIIADTDSGNITLTFGPISPSDLQLSGLTFIFTGTGTVTIR
jgi:hypothetical protein